MISVVKIGLASLLFLLVSGNLAQAAVATDCTLYAAAYGNDANSGASPTRPKTLPGASKASVPGSVICLRGGTYYLSKTFSPAKSGAANAWIVYKNYSDSAVQLVWTGGTSASNLNMFHFFSKTLSASSRSYIEIRGLQFDGRNAATFALKCNSSHHLRFVSNTIQNMGMGGISSRYCDYLTAYGNQITHNGYTQGEGSGISYNRHQWLDSAPGFHSFVVNNRISGSYDVAYHNDGNGIIMDMSNGSKNLATANTPPVLIANNVVYQNGGRCIELLSVSNIWTVHNTCYKSALDTSYAYFAEFMISYTKNSYFINNIAYGWNNRQTYQQQSPNQNLVYYKNLYYGGSVNFTYPDPTQFIKADPLFVSPPALDPTKGRQYATARTPAQLGDGLALQATSPAIGKGINPTKLSGISAEIIAGLRKYVLKDIAGTPRPQGNNFDLGAYEYAP